MAHHKSAVRQRRRSVRRTAINKKNKSELRTDVRRMRDLVQAQKKDDAQKHLAELQSTIDKAVKKRTIHKNKGDRLKSRLGRQVSAAASKPA